MAHACAVISKHASLVQVPRDQAQYCMADSEQAPAISALAGLNDDAEFFEMTEEHKHWCYDLVVKSQLQGQLSATRQAQLPQYTKHAQRAPILPAKPVQRAQQPSRHSRLSFLVAASRSQALTPSRYLSPSKHGISNCSVKQTNIVTIQA